MEILKYIYYLCINKKKYIQLFFVSVFLFIFIIQYKNPNYIQLICQVLLIIILIIWIQSTPKYYYRLNSLKTLFNSSQDYCNLCKRYINQWSYLKIHNLQSALEKRIRILYFITWIVTWGSSIAIILFVFKLIPFDCIGITTITLLFISLTLNFSSYYLSLTLVYFFKRVSLLNDLQYNKYLPSATWGLQKLLFYTREGSSTFLIVTLLYTILYTVLILSGIQNKNIFNAINDHSISLLFIIVSLFIIGFITYFIIFIVPKIFLSNLHKNWKEQSLKTFERELLNAENINDDKKIDLLVNRINTLQKDRFINQFNTFEILVTLSTILINIISIYNFILKI